MNEAQIFEVSTMDMLSMSIVVLFVGMYLNRRIRLLGDNYIPPAVTGGLLFAVGVAILYKVADIQLEFDMRMRDLLLLVFFSSVGLSARLRALATGGKALIVLVLIAGVFLFLQNSVGIAVVMAFGENPFYGLIAGSVAFAGGHGTAIAWGQLAEDGGMTGASLIGLSFATFGLVAGGIVGGPIARYLMNRQQITTPPPPDISDVVKDAIEITENEDGNWLYLVLASVLILTLCVSMGDIVNRSLAEHGIRLPGFLTSMFIGIIIVNTTDVLGRPIKMEVIEKFSELALNIFLAMSMMAIQLWTLASAIHVMSVVLLLQIILMVLYAIFVVYRFMGKDYDAVVIASGFAGMGLGATPVAIANMDAVTTRFGASTKAFLVVPLVGAFFIDILNAGTINFFIELINKWLL